MIKLYIDFDGVILNTIDVSYKMLDDSGIDLSDNVRVQDFYCNLDWKKLIEDSEPINNSIVNLRKLMDSKLYDISILTHINSSYEKEIKLDFMKRNFEGLDIIFVEKKDDKCDVVDCFDAVLVDDYMDNLLKWESKGGIAVKFSTTDKEYECIDISSLDMLIDKYEEIKQKMSGRKKKLLV